ncbi:AT-rich interactive domain-containing protein 6-like isoform X2 [Tasmannia lanceolata]|uniref:AT-rich interactive domain-containing protein 6-like isoform X2 n=1 Tax=Tasmannia lanceolata TaxID=3420 RepID=UPI004064064F
MSEPKDNEELEADSLEGSDPVDDEVEGVQRPSENPIECGQSDENGSQLLVEAHFSDDPGFVEPIPEPNSTVQTGDGDGLLEITDYEESHMDPANEMEHDATCNGISELKSENENGFEETTETKDGMDGVVVVQSEDDCFKEASLKQETLGDECPVNTEGSNQSFPLEQQWIEGDESGTEVEQAAFMKEVENFFRERSMEFKPPKFYGEGLNCLKLWRAVIRLGGYDQVTSCKLWRQVGESFKPPKTCTTVSWSFRCFYEKALLDYERHKIRCGELCVPATSLTEPMSVDNQVAENQTPGSGRARRDAAARAMQGWHSQRLLGNGEDKSPVSLPKREKQLKSLGVPKRKKPSSLERAVKAARTKVGKPHDGQIGFSTVRTDTMVVDIGPSADWVKINVRRTKDCFEVYALVPGLLREEVRVQSDPAGRLVISGEPEQPDNPWGVTPFRKVINLPSRIDPHQTSAVVTLHGQLFVRAPFEQPNL